MYTIAEQKCLDEYNVKFNPEVKAMMMGRKALEGVKILAEYYGLDFDHQKHLGKRTKIADELFPNADLMPGALRLLLHLKKCGIPMAVATSSNRRHFEMKTSRHTKLFSQVFDHVLTGDDVTKSKPDPEIFVKAAQKFDSEIDPGKVLVFEDAHLGVEAGIKANMKVIWVYDEQNPNKENGAHLKIQSLFYFKPEQFGLPKF